MVNLTSEDFAEATAKMKRELQREREIKRDEVHRVMMVALHTDSLWEKGK